MAQPLASFVKPGPHLIALPGWRMLHAIADLVQALAQTHAMLATALPLLPKAGAGLPKAGAGLPTRPLDLNPIAIDAGCHPQRGSV
jgi:hypothetical protein